MIWLGLLLPICYICGITGASVPTQWALLSLSLPLFLWRTHSPPTVLHYLGWGFAAYSILGLLWAPHWQDTVYGLWIVALWSLSFQLGYVSKDLRKLWIGLALGVSVSSILAIPQWFGYEPVAVFNHNVAGLLFNRTVLGAACALVVLALIEHRLWWYIPALTPGLLLSGSRGGWLVLGFGLISKLHWAIGLGLLIVVSLIYDPTSSDILRLQIWGVALKGLTWLGWSAGSFNDVYFLNASGITHPEFVHNDYLQLWFEFGIMALAPYTILFSALAWRGSAVLWAFALLGAFYFPLYSPLTSFIGCVALGDAMRGFSFDGLIFDRWRSDLLPWSKNIEPKPDPTWSEAVPFQPRASY